MLLAFALFALLALRALFSDELADNPLPLALWNGLWCGLAFWLVGRRGGTRGTTQEVEQQRPVPTYPGVPLRIPDPRGRKSQPVTAEKQGMAGP
jgi:hypothetical protein